MEQLLAFSPWTSNGHQGMVQTRSMTRIAEETRRKFTWAPTCIWAFGRWTMMMILTPVGSGLVVIVSYSKSVKYDRKSVLGIWPEVNVLSSSFHDPIQG